MKRNKIILALASISLLTSSCNSYLDTPPDRRIELDSPDKIQRLLVSAYPTVSIMGLLEHRTDNVEDNGSRYTMPRLILQQNYNWQPTTEADWDSAERLWVVSYNAIGAANQALEAIQDLGNGPQYQAAKGEALLCRAFANFVMLGVFAQPYNSQTSETDLGVPYWLTAEKKIYTTDPRRTVKECFELIEKDILEGLPLIDDDIYKTGTELYHFTKKAAYAFAAQFYLYYEKWAEAKRYATLAIGEDPSASLRNIGTYVTKYGSSAKEWTNGYNSVNEPANLLLQPTNVRWGRMYLNLRYAHSRKISQGTYLSNGPWGTGTLSGFASSSRSYTSYPNALIFIHKHDEYFVMTNLVARTGSPYTVARPLTVDKTLFVRAEAEVMLGEYDNAARDLSYWYVANGGAAATAQAISDFYVVPDEAGLDENQLAQRQERLESVCKPLNPYFSLTPGMQYNMMLAVLHAKRIDGVHDGTRWDDIKRYGLEVKHPLEGQDTLVLTSRDLRKALQIPSSIVSAGLAPNPR